MKLTQTAQTLATSAHPGLVLARFLAVGAGLVVLYTALSSVFALALGAPAAAASALGYLLSIPVGYWAQRTLAFRSAAPHGRAFVRYLALQLPLLGLSALLSWALITQMHGPTIVSFLVVGPIVAIASFTAQRLWAFSQH